MGLFNLVSNNAQLLRRKPTRPGKPDTAPERSAGVEGVGAVPRPRLGISQFAQRRIEEYIAVCVRFCDELVGCVPGYDDRDRSGDEVCAVGEAEQICFA